LDKAERPDMSGLGADMSEITFWYPDKELDKARITCDKEEGSTCPARASGIRVRGQI
jgi:hypothetical protein